MKSLKVAILFSFLASLGTTLAMQPAAPTVVLRNWKNETRFTMEIVQEGIPSSLNPFQETNINRPLKGWSALRETPGFLSMGAVIQKEVKPANSTILLMHYDPNAYILYSQLYRNGHKILDISNKMVTPEKTVFIDGIVGSDENIQIKVTA